MTRCYGVNGFTEELLLSALKAFGILIAFDTDEPEDRAARRSPSA